ncbi:larval cuticle protein 65Ag1-like [Musca domestica]|uniref:Larval cuticle protein 65Ag1-like n=1 Tax=Musca domestica TaxID=7370 RepID=A0A9J7DDK4_MUSDO|nr:larval cuticle protein 65Ag1-like [Musca domestica]
MKFLLVLVALFAITLAAPAPETLKLDTDFVAEGKLEELPGDEYGPEGIVVRGTYSFKDPHDGSAYNVSYVADEKGCKIAGDHILNI